MHPPQMTRMPTNPHTDPKTQGTLCVDTNEKGLEDLNNLFIEYRD